MKKYLLPMVIVFGLILAACGGGATTEAPAPATAAPATSAPAAPTEAPVEDAIGVVEIGPGEPIHIAWMLTVSGATEFLGADSLGAVEIAVEERGQIEGHDILLTGEDSGCSAEGGQTAATRVAADPTILGIIGTNCSSAMTAAMSRAGVMIGLGDWRPRHGRFSVEVL